jgi:hypothetical protein
MDMPVRQEILEDGTVEQMTVVDGKIFFVRYRDIDEALSKAKDLLVSEQRSARKELNYQRFESASVHSSVRTKTP